MKKIAICSLLMCLGWVNFAGAAAAKTGSCEFFASPNDTPRDQELWYSDLRKTDALQCIDADKGCPDNIFVMMKDSKAEHYQGNGNGKALGRGTGPAFYQCKHGITDPEWYSKTENDLPECNESVKNLPGHSSLGYLKSVKDSGKHTAYVGVCKKRQTTDRDTDCDVKYCHDGACLIVPRDCSLVGKCDGKKAGDACQYNGSHSNNLKCVQARRKTTDAPELTCAAQVCDNNYLLWLSGTTPHSMGVCHKESDVIARCKRGCGCSANEECVPNYMDNPNGLGGKAYWDCHCVAKGGNDQSDDGPVHEEPVVNETPDGDCTYTFEAIIKCADGSVHNDSHTATFSKAELGTENCPSFEERFQHDAEQAKILADRVCAQSNAGASLYNNIYMVITNNIELNNAKTKLSEFFAATDSSKSGLKTADGKFNTVRLASDISAGVVLGTVGGVVSGVVIKKKQVEKGFEALHCTVGGQKIADWGDTFEVGLQK